jgi:hypothetical protein
MTTKFTKGPWKWVEDRNTGGFYGLYAGVHPVVYPQRCNDGDEGLAWFSTDESYYGETALTEANAALIACAPEMYELLDEISDGLLEAGGFGNCALAKRIEALLAKARGEA